MDVTSVSFRVYALLLAAPAIQLLSQRFQRERLRCCFLSFLAIFPRLTEVCYHSTFHLVG